MEHFILQLRKLIKVNGAMLQFMSCNNLTLFLDSPALVPSEDGSGKITAVGANVSKFTFVVLI